MSEPSPERLVLITGATGALGPAVIRAFASDGWRIRTLSRTPPAAGAPAAAHQHVVADIEDFSALCRAMNGADAIVHMAALLHVFDRSARLNAEYRRVNVQGTSAVMAAARDRSVPQVIVLSSIAVYGTHTRMVDEDTVPAPDSPYAASKLEGEAEALRTTSPDGKPLASVLRLAAVYGPSVKGNYERLVRALARRWFVQVGNGRNARTLVFEDDAAQAILLAASRPDARGMTFNVTDGQIHEVRRIIAAIADALGRRPPRVSVPARLATVGARSMEKLFGLLGRRSPVTAATLDKYLEHVAVSGRRLQDTLGFEPRWPLAAGWRQTVEQLRREGRL
jgi:nucleoside-diphosphate-sugar epimerase